MTAKKTKPTQELEISAIDVLKNTVAEQQNQIALLKKDAVFNKKVINGTNAIIFSINKDGNIIDFSDGAIAISGYSLKDVKNKNAIELFIPTEKYTILNKFKERLFSANFKDDFEAPLTTKTGEEKLISWKIHTFNEDKNNNFLVCLGKDITELRLQSAKLQERETQFRLLAESLPLPMVCIGKNGEIKFLNDAYVDLVGYTIAELPNMKVLCQTVYTSKKEGENAYSRWKNDTDKTKKQNHTFFRQIQLKHKNGNILDIETHGAVNEEYIYYGCRDITKQKVLEKQLKDGKEYFQNVAENIPISMAIVDLNMNCLFFNKELEKILGYTLEEIPTAAEAFKKVIYKNADDEAEQGKIWEYSMDFMLKNPGKSPAKLLKTVLCKDGSIKELEVCFSIQNNLLHVVFIDVTYNKHIEKELKTAKKYFERLAQNIPLPVAISTISLTSVFFNKEFIRVLGFTLEDLPTVRDGYGYLIFDNEETIAKEKIKFKQYIENLIKNPNNISPILERRVRCKDGSIKDFEVSISIQNSLIHSIFNDVTEKKQQQKLLLQNEQKFRKVAENIALPMICHTNSVELVFTNKKFVDVFGISVENSKMYNPWLSRFYYPTKEIENTQLLELVTTIEDLKSNLKKVAPILERCIKDKNNQIRTYEIALTVQDELVYGLFNDITERKQNEQQLFESEQRFKALAENMPIAIGSQTIDGEINFLNKYFTDTLGYTQKEIPTLVKWYKKTQPNPETRKVLYNHWQQIVSDFRSGTIATAPYIETTLHCKNGEVKTFSFLFSLHQNLVYIMLVDITDRRKAEQELIGSHHQLRELASHLQKVREDERKYIAREIHDELGQLITGLKMDISSCKKKIEKITPELTERLNSIIDLTDTIVQTVRRISAELRPSILDDIGLGAALQWQTKEFEKRTSIKCIFINRIGDLELSVEIKSNLFRIFQESLTNIIRHANATNVYSSIQKNKNIITLSITDNGKGFKTNLQSKTLGLVGMKERAIMINGVFTVESSVGIGTNIKIEVPI